MHGTLPTRDLDALAIAIKQDHDESQRAAGCALQHAIAAGKGLNEAKRLLKKSRAARWLPWLRDHVNIPERTAQLYMRLAAHAAEVLDKSATVADFGVRESVKLLAKPARANNGATGFQSWHTPKSIIDPVVEVLGTIDLDPAWEEGCLVKARTTYTKSQDGLSRPWRGRVFMNPPYNATPLWVAKMLDEYAAGRVVEAIALLPASTDSKWCRTLRDFPVCLVNGRLRYANAVHECPTANLIFYLGKRPDRFARAFAEIGDVFVRYALAGGGA